MNNKNKLDEALINIVNYLWLDELKHYKESDQRCATSFDRYKTC